MRSFPVAIAMAIGDMALAGTIIFGLSLPAVAQNALQQPPPDPEMVQAELRGQLAKTMMEAAQFQAKAAQAQAALKAAQAKITELENASKDGKPTAAAEPPKPTHPVGMQHRPQKP